jgi:hypothetical protein
MIARFTGQCRPETARFLVRGIASPTKSLQIALSDLKLERAWIVHAGTKTYPVHERVEALPLAKLGELVDTIMN